MLQYVRGARSQYEEASKATKAKDDAKSALKRKISSEIKDLETKKAKLTKAATSAVLSLEHEIKVLKKLKSLLLVQSRLHAFIMK